MLYYDILITFGEEVEKIWQQRFTFVTVLWFMVGDLSKLDGRKLHFVENIYPQSTRPKTLGE